MSLLYSTDKHNQPGMTASVHQSPIKLATIVSQSNEPPPAAKNTLFKGWILVLQDGSSSTSTSLKWVPKFAVVNKLERTVLLYDYEVNNQQVVANSGVTTTNGVNNGILNNGSVSVLKMDNSVKREAFIQHWRNKSENFENDFNKYLNDGFSKSNSISNRLSNIFHISSSKDTADTLSFEKDFESNADGSDHDRGNNTTNTPFRFAGLFFKKDKGEKVKHSSLKRAKSGIQLERKKPAVLVQNLANMSVMDTKRNYSTDYNDFDNRLNLPSPMRPSRSHESLASPLKPVTGHQDQPPNQFTKSSSIKSKLKLLGNQTPSSKSVRANTNTQAAKKSFQTSNRESIIKFNLNSTNHHSPVDTKPEPIVIRSIHTSLFNEENCFEVKSFTSNISIQNTVNEYNSFETDFSEDDDYIDYEYADDESQQRQQYRHGRQRNNGKAGQRAQQQKCSISSEAYSARYFLCRSAEEREKWLQCLQSVADDVEVLSDRRHADKSIQVWLLEAKGQAISSKPTRKYFCEVFLNNTLYARTCCRERKEILFWGENFDFNHVQCNCVRIELYQETTTKKKTKKDKENLNTTHKEPTVHSHLSNQTLLGYVTIPVNSIEGSQPVEKWYRLEPPSSLSVSSSDEPNHHQPLCGQDSLSNSTISANQQLTSNSIASLTTTQNFSKDAISIRIKAKYQSVDILPLECYRKLIEYFRTKYLDLMLTLEPHLNVRVKDDLANSLVQIAHKLRIQRAFLSDLVLAEIMQLEDSSLTFRGNSLATKAMEFYMKLVGDGYLKQTLSDCVRSIIDTNHELEIDPSKVSNQSSLQANREELVQILHLVCGRVFNSCINFPIEMKHVFATLRQKCIQNGKTDEMCDILISASIFLRFICPAILSPNLFNLTQEYPQEKAARKLTLAAKTLQTISNFSKFGGKESYMSFDKMNQFVEEHTILMREFLRNISTLTPEDLEEDQQKMMIAETKGRNTSSILPIVTLTPQTPDTPHRSIRRQYQIDQAIDLSAPRIEEGNFEPELIDLGKQLSISHSLLVTILSGLEESTKSKFTDELLEILNEISDMKRNPNISNFPSNETDQINAHQNKLYSYENRLHVVMKNHQMGNNSPATPPTETSDFCQPHPSNQQRYSSQVTVNMNESGQHRLENDINMLKSQLRDTEISLKKEQTEKYLIEYKLKQQQQDNDLQMRSIINRLIKVEEELRKEQVEMHKLLKAKQDLIDIQKKRIEHLTNRNSTLNSNSNKSIGNGMQPKSNNTSNNSMFQQLNNSNSNIVDNKANQYSEHEHNQSKDAWVPASKPHLSELHTTQIAASPSSSSSSMTQFCKYLAQNTLIQPSQGDLDDLTNFNKQNKRKSYHQNHALDEMTKSNPRMLSPTPNGVQADATSSSTSSSSSALSTSSSLNHLNQNQSNPTVTSFNFFRTSEL